MKIEKAASVLFNFQNRLNWQLSLSLKNNNKMCAHRKLVPFRLPLRENVGNSISCLSCGQVKELPEEMLMPQPLWIKSKHKLLGFWFTHIWKKTETTTYRERLSKDRWQKVTLLDKIGKTAISILYQSHRLHGITLFNTQASGRREASKEIAYCNDKESNKK